MKISLIIIFIGLLTVAPAVYTGIKYFDGKVTEHPYETGLKYDADKKFISENGLGIEVESCVRDGENVNLEFKLDGRNVTVEQAVFYVTRPATDKNEINIKTMAKPDGQYASVFALPSHGYHILKAECRINGREITLQKSFNIN